jgi:hypothetical protein
MNNHHYQDLLEEIASLKFNLPKASSQASTQIYKRLADCYLLIAMQIPDSNECVVYYLLALEAYYAKYNYQFDHNLALSQGKKALISKLLTQIANLLKRQNRVEVYNQLAERLQVIWKSVPWQVGDFKAMLDILLLSNYLYQDELDMFIHTLFESLVPAEILSYHPLLLTSMAILLAEAQEPLVNVDSDLSQHISDLLWLCTFSQSIDKLFNLDQQIEALSRPHSLQTSDLKANLTQEKQRFEQLLREIPTGYQQIVINKLNYMRQDIQSINPKLAMLFAKLQLLVSSDAKLDQTLQLNFN